MAVGLQDEGELGQEGQPWLETVPPNQRSLRAADEHFGSDESCPKDGDAPKSPFLIFAA